MIGLVLLGLSNLLLADVAPPVQWVTGNGGLCVAIDDNGQLTQFHWPAVGRGQHLDISPPGPSGGGWYLASPDGVYTLRTDDWDIETQYESADSLILVTRFREHVGGRVVEQRVRVAPAQDLLLIQVRLLNFDPDTRLFWRASFTPFDGLLPGFHDRVPLLRRLNAFGSEYDSGLEALVQFRPSHPGQEEWKRLNEWATSPQPSSDVEFERGVYIGTISPNAIAHGTVVSDQADWSNWRGGAPFPGVARQTGRAIGVLELVPTSRESLLEASILVGAEATREALEKLLLNVRQQDLGAIFDTSATLGASWLAAGGSATAPSRSLLNLLLCMDHDTGAVRCAPADEPALAISRVFESAWASAALDVCGYPNRAESALAIHLDQVRRRTTSSGPAGSLPDTSYSEGLVATIQANADPESAAWLLAACWRHARAGAEDATAAWLASAWPELESCATYLAREPEVGAGLSGAAATAAVPLATLRVHYLGLESGRRLAELLGQPVPGFWVDRLGELYSRIRFRRLNQENGDVAATPWIDWWIGTLPKRKAEPDAAWAVLQTEGAPELSDEAINAVIPGNGPGIYAPLALRDALRCLLAH